MLLGDHACSHSHITDSYPGTVGYSQVTTPAFTPIIHTHPGTARYQQATMPGLTPILHTITLVQQDINRQACLHSFPYHTQLPW